MKVIEIKDEKVGKGYDHIYSLEKDGLRKVRLGEKYFFINAKDEKIGKE